MKTYLPKVNLNERKWHVVDANGAVLGRLAGPDRKHSSRETNPVHAALDAGDFVVVINAEKVVVTAERDRQAFMSTPAGRAA